MSEETWTVLIIFVVVTLFAVFFREAFMATADFLDSTRCSIGMDYCKDE